MSFPTSPLNGQTTTINNIPYVYNSTNRAWTRSTSLASNVTIGVLTVNTTVSAANVLAAQIGNSTSTVTANTVTSATHTITSTTNPTGLGTGALTVTQGGASIYQDLWVGGNIYANTLNTVTTSILSIQDPLLYLTSSPVYPYNYEIGFYGHFIGGPANTYAHTGFVRNHVDNAWYLFSNVPEPGGNTINLASSNTILDTLKLGQITVANTTVSVSNTTGALVVAGGAGLGGNLYVGANATVTGVLSGAEVLASNGLHLNANTINTSYTVPQGYNVFAVGPITMASGVTMTLPSGSRYVVI
jgi:hypothetical protein